MRKFAHNRGYNREVSAFRITERVDDFERIIADFCDSFTKRIFHNRAILRQDNFYVLVCRNNHAIRQAFFVDVDTPIHRRINGKRNSGFVQRLVLYNNAIYPVFLYVRATQVCAERLSILENLSRFIVCKMRFYASIYKLSALCAFKRYHRRNGINHESVRLGIAVIVRKIQHIRAVCRQFLSRLIFHRNAVFGKINNRFIFPIKGYRFIRVALIFYACKRTHGNGLFVFNRLCNSVNASTEFVHHGYFVKTTRAETIFQRIYRNCLSIIIFRQSNPSFSVIVTFRNFKERDVRRFIYTFRNSHVKAFLFRVFR